MLERSRAPPCLFGIFTAAEYFVDALFILYIFNLRNKDAIEQSEYAATIATDEKKIDAKIVSSTRLILIRCDSAMLI